MGRKVRQKKEDRRPWARCLRLDAFGEAVKMNIAGEATYNTTCGLFFTLLVFITSIAFLALKSLLMMSYGNTNFSQTKESNVIDLDDVFGYNQTEFAIAFGFVDSRLRAEKQPSLTELNRYTSFQVEQIEHNVTEGGLDQDQATKLGLHKCT